MLWLYATPTVGLAMVVGANVMVGGTDETGVTLFDAADAAPVPAELVAVTVKV